MKEEKLKKYVIDIEYAAKFFERHFINKEIIYSTQNQSISIKFKRSNFMHLCGVKYNDGATEFFQAAISKKLDLKKINIKADGTTFLKLSLLGSIDLLLGSEISLTESVIYLNLSFDKALRTKKQILALTLINNDSIFIPQSLLNLKNMHNFPKGEKIISIKSIHLQDKTETVYL